MIFKLIRVTVTVILIYIILTIYSVSDIEISIPAKISPYIPKLNSPSPNPVKSYPPLNPEDLYSGINLYRQQSKLPAIIKNDLICSLVDELKLDPEKFRETIVKKCPNCTQVVSAYLDLNGNKDEALDYLESDSTASAILKNRKLTASCIKIFANQAVILAAQIIVHESPTPARVITEEELWSSLSEYRKAQKSNPLNMDESLCIYARKRVEDHIVMYKSRLPQSSYPVPGKYPLDAHEGFKKDADTGYVFDVTGKSAVAENLAYWPNAQYGVHVIEWGWDSSTEGHRETQLSNDYSSACITGKQGFFVAIFGK